MGKHELINIWHEAKLTDRIANPSRIARDKKVDAAFDNQGNLRAAAVGAAVLLTRDFEITGTATTGTSGTVPRRMPQSGRAVRLDASAGTAPSGGEFTAQLYANGSLVGSVSISNGETAGGSNLNATISAGAVLTWNVTTANGAADVGLSLVYRVG